jgi:hypothetical protein
MLTKELINYVKVQLDAGVSQEEIVDTLVNHGGWTKYDVLDAFAELGKENAIVARADDPKLDVSHLQDAETHAPLQKKHNDESKHDVSTELLSEETVATDAETTQSTMTEGSNKEEMKENTIEHDKEKATPDEIKHEKKPPQDSSAHIGKEQGSALAKVPAPEHAPKQVDAPEASKSESTKKKQVDERKEDVSTFVAESDTKRERLSKMSNTQSNFMLTSILTLILLGLIAGAVYAYVVFHGSQTPHTVLSSSIRNVMSQSSYKQEGVVKVETKMTQEGMSEPISFTSSAEFVARTQDAGDARNMDGFLSIHTGGSYTVFSLDFNLEMEMRVVDNVLYVYVSRISELPLEIDMSPVTQRWIAFDIERFSQEVGSFDETTLGVSDLDQETFLGIAEDILQDPEIISFINEHFVLVEDSPENEDVRNTNAYHYRLDLSTDDLKELFVELSVALYESESFRAFVFASGNTVSDIGSEGVRQEATRQIENMYSNKQWEVVEKALDTMEFEFWVDKSKLLPTGIKFALATSDSETPNMQTDFNILIDMTLSEYGEAFVVEAPQSADPINNVAKEVTGDPDFNIYNPFEEAQQKGRDANTKATVSNLRVYAELYYGDNAYAYEGVCTSEKFQDGLEMLPDALCFDTLDSYAFEAPLVYSQSDVQEYYCVDSTGFNGVTTQTIDASTLCELP